MRVTFVASGASCANSRDFEWRHADIGDGVLCDTSVIYDERDKTFHPAF